MYGNIAWPDATTLSALLTVLSPVNSTLYLGGAPDDVVTTEDLFVGTLGALIAATGNACIGSSVLS